MSPWIKHPRSSLPASLAALLALCLPQVQALPVFMADNHAETYGWITRTFDPDGAFTLVLIDAHSDASASERSEEMREGIRRVPDLATRAARVEQWRAEHRLQAFNWIEPLMPRPLDQVRWFAPASAGDPQTLNSGAVASLDGRLEVEPRSSGPFAKRWQTAALADFATWQPERKPVILSIDLDTFAEMDAGKTEEKFAEIWKQAMSLPDLSGVAFAISRPWLKDDEQAARLVRMALRAVRHTRGATLEWDASMDDRPDDSLNAEGLRQDGRPVPRWDLSKAPAQITAELALMHPAPRITDRKREWKPGHFPRPETIAPTKGEIDIDGVWRFRIGEEPILRLSPPGDATGKVRWQLLRSASAAYDLLPQTGLGKGFSENAARHIYEESVSLGGSEDFLLDPATWKTANGGSFRITAEYETSSGWLPAGSITLRIRNGEGFHGALSECQGMPYVFGIAGVSEDDLSGVETGWGSDCANLLIYAWRRNGIPLAWGDPGRLRRQLAVKSGNTVIEAKTSITSEEVRRGIAIDFGSHVAALWEDRPPLGQLDGSDLVMHHLGGRPEIIPLEKLLPSRPQFSLLTPRTSHSLRVAFAGDVVLAGDDLASLPEFGRQEFDLFFGNLEGIPSNLEPATKPRFDFRFAPEKISLLKKHRFSAVSLANNHALDAGPDGLLEGMRALRERHIPFAGAGADEREACSPQMIEAYGTKVALYGVSIVGDGAAGPDSPGVAMLPHHSRLLEESLRTSKKAGAKIVILLHGGDEYSAKVNDDQRRWARWLIARGASIIAGSHPHVVQREEVHGGAVVLHSLGNAVYPKHLKGADSGKIRVIPLASDAP
jgi:hypothetical protein